MATARIFNSSFIAEELAISDDEGDSGSAMEVSGDDLDYESDATSSESSEEVFELSEVELTKFHCIIASILSMRLPDTAPIRIRPTSCHWSVQIGWCIFTQRILLFTSRGS